MEDEESPIITNPNTINVVVIDQLLAIRYFLNLISSLYLNDGISETLSNAKKISYNTFQRLPLLSCKTKISINHPKISVN